ncbi:MAG: mannose-6-phosphate isomerase, class I [Deltaproteobacteria bacterium]|nr:mannose-6-phosphate isomerase, class I [Deltaproteobacteria bacterium]
MNKIALLKNPILEYAWGSRTAIPSLLGLPVPSERPAAELWLGAHPKAPSRVLVDGVWQSLETVIEKDPISLLGKDVAERFSNRFPFLFKVLAAERPLSIQVHPDLEQARAGFEKENCLGIALDAARRNYRDSNHKPEILCAVTRFEALKGFRPPEDVLSLLERVAGGTLSDELDLLRRDPDSRGLRRFVTSLLSMDAFRKGDVVGQAVEGAGPLTDMDRAFWWMVALHGAYPGDIGVLSPLFLNLVTLDPGEAIYIPAGQPHAYLQGMGMELMANSDNVLRGGLTPKHIDVPELLRIVDFRFMHPQKLQSEPGRQPAERIYETPAAEFQLAVITVSDGISFQSERDRSVDILICMEGCVRMQGLKNSDSGSVEKGMSVLIPAAVGPYQIAGEATLYRATVGRHT